MGRPHQPSMYSTECLRELCLVPSYFYFTLTTSPLPSIPPCISLVYFEVKSPADSLTLRDDTNKLYEWAERWQMNFNVTKCAVMSLSTQKVLQYDYIMNAQVIPRVRKRDYLGITISSYVTWKDQCTEVGNKAKLTLGVHVPGRHTPRGTNSV